MEANKESNSTKILNITQPSCMTRPRTDLKRALVILDLQEGFLSSCKYNITSPIMVPDSYRLIPRINAFYEWIFLNFHDFYQIHISQSQYSNGFMLNEFENPLAKNFIYEIKDLYR